MEILGYFWKETVSWTTICTIHKHPNDKIVQPDHTGGKPSTPAPLSSLNSR